MYVCIFRFFDWDIIVFIMNVTGTYRAKVYAYKTSLNLKKVGMQLGGLTQQYISIYISLYFGLR